MLNYGDRKVTFQQLKITIPEDLEYQETFDGVFTSFGIEYKLKNIKNTSLGSLYQLTYLVQLPSEVDIQEFINQIRIRNSNLNISINLIENIDY